MTPSTHDVSLAGTNSRAEMRQGPTPSAGGGAVSRWGSTSWLLLSVAGLALVKLPIYVIAAQPYGGAEQGLCQWDCQWYTHTIQHGYDPAPRLLPYHDFANWAFFPFFPLLARGLMAVTGLGAFWSGTSVAVLSFAAFAVLSCRYRALTRGPEARDLPWLVLLFVYPFSLYFFMVYSESTYLLLTVLLLLTARTCDPVGAGVTASLLGATRPTGVIAIPYLAVERAWYARLAFRTNLGLPHRIRVLADAAFPLAVAPLGLACYMAYLYWLTGDALAFSHVQVAWDRTLFDPLKTFYWGMAKSDWHYLLDPGTPTTKSYSAAFAIPAGAACLWLLVRGRLLETWLLGATVILSLATGAMSLPRFVAANPVFLLVVGDAVDLIRPRAVRLALAVGSVGLQAFLLHTWFIQSTLLM